MVETLSVYEENHPEMKKPGSGVRCEEWEELT
jgi:hypothetical protein